MEESRPWSSRTHEFPRGHWSRIFQRFSSVFFLFPLSAGSLILSLLTRSDCAFFFLLLFNKSSYYVLNSSCCCLKALNSAMFISLALRADLPTERLQLMSVSFHHRRVAPSISASRTSRVALYPLVLHLRGQMLHLLSPLHLYLDLLSALVATSAQLATSTFEWCLAKIHLLLPSHLHTSFPQLTIIFLLARQRTITLSVLSNSPDDTKDRYRSPAHLENVERLVADRAVNTGTTLCDDASILKRSAIENI